MISIIINELKGVNLSWNPIMTDFFFFLKPPFVAREECFWWLWNAWRSSVDSVSSNKFLVWWSWHWWLLREKLFSLEVFWVHPPPPWLASNFYPFFFLHKCHFVWGWPINMAFLGAISATLRENRECSSLPPLLEFVLAWCVFNSFSGNLPPNLRRSRHSDFRVVQPFCCLLGKFGWNCENLPAGWETRQKFLRFLGFNVRCRF